MRFYASWVLPRILDLAMQNQALLEYRRKTIGAARGLVLEVGVGSGLNLPLYGGRVDCVYALDPSRELLALAHQRLRDAAIPVFLARASAEEIPFASSVFDTIVMTWTLCSIPNPTAALQQMRRVLKPDGRLIFVEHGRSPEARINFWQDRLTPTWKHIAGGCHLNLKVDVLLEEAGFRISNLKRFYLSGPRPMTYTYQGIA